MGSRSSASHVLTSCLSELRSGSEETHLHRPAHPAHNRRSINSHASHRPSENTSRRTCRDSPVTKAGICPSVTVTTVTTVCRPGSCLASMRPPGLFSGVPVTPQTKPQLPTPTTQSRPDPNPAPDGQGVHPTEGCRLASHCPGHHSCSGSLDSQAY